MFIGLFWFFFSYYSIICEKSLLLKNLMDYAGIRNNMSSKEESFSKTKEEVFKKIKDLKGKEKDISKIKNNLQEFTNSLEEMDIIKKAIEKKNK